VNWASLKWGEILTFGIFDFNSSLCYNTYTETLTAGTAMTFILIILAAVVIGSILNSIINVFFLKPVADKLIKRAASKPITSTSKYPDWSKSKLRKR
jgi:hypothetical protein